MSVTCFVHFLAQHLFMWPIAILDLLCAKQCSRNSTDRKQLSNLSFHLNGPDNQRTANFSLTYGYTTEKMKWVLGGMIMMARGGIPHWGGRRSPPYRCGDIWPEIWRRKWQPTPVLLPGKFHGWRSLVGYTQSMMGLQRVGHNWATSLSFFLYFVLEKEMATHSSDLAWRIPWTEGPGGLWSMGLQRVGYD